MKKNFVVASATIVLLLAGLAGLAQESDGLFELRAELIDRIETAYTDGDSATLSRMVSTERQMERLRGAGPGFFRQANAIGVSSFRVCPNSYSYVSASKMCVPEAVGEPVGSLLVTRGVPEMVTDQGPVPTPPYWPGGVRPPQPPWPSIIGDGNHDPGEPGFYGGPDVGTPTFNITCGPPAALAAATACTVEQSQICSTGPAAQCNAKTAECSALWANVTCE